MLGAEEQRGLTYEELLQGIADCGSTVGWSSMRHLWVALALHQPHLDAVAPHSLRTKLTLHTSPKGSAQVPCLFPNPDHLHTHTLPRAPASPTHR